jgi:hypothetical protein
MLQAYMDESARGDFFVVAGFISTVESWAALSDEWAGLLTLKSAHYPALDEFHMREMHSSPERLEMTEWFYRIAEKYITHALSVTINVTEIDAEFERFGWEDEASEVARNPYVLAFNQILYGLEAWKATAGNTEPVNFVFDNHGDWRKCLDAWEYMKETNPSFAATCGEMPVFRDSAATMPLQAADLLAWWIRLRREQERHARTAREIFPWEPKIDYPMLSGYLAGEVMRSEWARQQDGGPSPGPTFVPIPKEAK